MENILPHAAPHYTLRAAVEQYLLTRWPQPEQRVNAPSYRDAKNRLRKFAAFDGTLELAAQSFDDAAHLTQRFLDSLRFRRLSATSIDNFRRVISRFWAWLMQQGLVSFRVNPAGRAFVSAPAVPTRVKPYPSDAEVRALLDAARDDPIFPQLAIAAGAGMRRSGIARLRPEHLDIEARHVKIFEKNRERLVPLSHWLCELLAPWVAKYSPRTRTGPTVDRQGKFTGKRAAGKAWRPFGPETLGHHVAKLRDKAKLPKYVTLQSLRRGYIRKLYEAGVAPQLAARLCGTSVETISKHYVELDTLNAQSVVDLVKY